MRVNDTLENKQIIKQKNRLGINRIENYIIIILLFAVFIFITSCEKPSDCTEHYFSDKYKTYVYSNSGSYWVFEDTILGIRDSVSLVSQSIQFDDNCVPPHRPEEKLQQRLVSSYFKGENNYNWTAYGYAELNEYYAGYILGWYSDNGGKAIDSMLINGIWYKDILEFTTANSKYYRAKGVGLIKKEFSKIESIDTTYHFELVKYQMN